MRLKVFESYLKVATPYMLRNDGSLLECGDIHPYVKYIQTDSDEKEIYNLVNSKRGNFLEWFYNNTNHQKVKDSINRLLSAIILNNYCKLEDGVKDYLTSTFDIYDLPNAKRFDIEAEFELLDIETRQEFCRVRTSDRRFGGDSHEIYFRISSIGFNWFNIIWEVVEDNRNFISDISICKDNNTSRDQYWYIHHGQVIHHMSVDDFLNLPGSPIVESCDPVFFDLMRGYLFEESTRFTHPAHIVNYYNNVVDNYFDQNFILT